MAQWIGLIVLDQLRIAGGAGGEVCQQYVIVFSRLISFRPNESFTCPFQLQIEVDPALPIQIPASHQGFDQGNVSRLSVGGIELCRNVVFTDADDELQICFFDAIKEVFGFQHMGGRDGDCAELVQAHHAHPELPAALEGEHCCIALLYPKALKEVGGFVA